MPGGDPVDVRVVIYYRKVTGQGGRKWIKWVKGGLGRKKIRTVLERVLWLFCRRTRAEGSDRQAPWVL